MIKAFLVLTCFLFSTPGFCIFKEGVVARVVSFSGNPLVRTLNASGGVGHIKRVQTNMSLVQGDAINTSSDGSVKLLMADRSIVDIGKSTLFSVDKFSKEKDKRDINLSLLYGTVRAGVTHKLEPRSRFRVRTKTATMGVRGTDFLVNTSLNQEGSQGVAASDLKVIVLQGQVGVSSNAVSGGSFKDTSVVIKEGEQLLSNGSFSQEQLKPQLLALNQALEARQEMRSVAPNQEVIKAISFNLKDTTQGEAIRKQEGVKQDKSESKKDEPKESSKETPRKESSPQEDKITEVKQVKKIETKDLGVIISSQESKRNQEQEKPLPNSPPPPAPSSLDFAKDIVVTTSTNIASQINQSQAIIPGTPPYANLNNPLNIHEQIIRNNQLNLMNQSLIQILIQKRTRGP